MVANPKKFNDENDYEYEVVWNGNTSGEGKEKGELLGPYASKSVLSTNHSYITRKIRGKIVSIQQPITKEEEENGEN